MSGASINLITPPDRAAASNEALYVNNSLGDKLYAFQSGNEPDVFNYGMRPPTYNYSGYQVELETYLSAVGAAVPQASFADPDVAHNTDWITAFTTSESRNVKLLNGRYYLIGLPPLPISLTKPFLPIVQNFTSYLLLLALW